MKNKDAFLLFNELKHIFDIVRLVDVAQNKQFYFNNCGLLVEESSQCFCVWNKSRRCENCISAKAFSTKDRMTKFEFIEHDVYYVISKYIELDSIPYMLELVIKNSDETLLGAYGQNDFVDAITAYNKKLYTDALTGAYNRLYLEEQLCGLDGIQAIAMIDVDNFKAVNDTFGHLAGDVALQSVVDSILSLIRSTDSLVRYGGDEFVLLFNNIPTDIFSLKLQKIKDTIQHLSIDEFPSLNITLSIGGIYDNGKIPDLIQEADELLYEAKQQKNSVIIRKFPIH